MRLLGMRSVIAAVQREGGMRCIQALRSLLAMTRTECYGRRPRFHIINMINCVVQRETVVLEKVPTCAGGRVLLNHERCRWSVA